LYSAKVSVSYTLDLFRRQPARALEALGGAGQLPSSSSWTRRACRWAGNVVTATVRARIARPSRSF